MLESRWISVVAIAVIGFGSVTASRLAGEAASTETRQQEIQLPKPKTSGGMSLNEALAKRRTQRKFADKALSIEQISQLCWAAQGITEAERGLRTAPSAGELYPITVYLIRKDGLFEYVPKAHALKKLKSDDIRSGSDAGPLGKAGIRSAPVCMVVAMNVSRLAARWPDNADRYCLLEAGHVAENVLLQATALGLVATPAGGVDGEKVVEVLGLPSEMEAAYVLPVGYPVAEKR
ncbi:MAG: SagB/ThcOx family dehydrogenase [Phycisphaerae bacterium]|nr:SagB/ThcOx family dehydrogenase [Phycisphaerae bacterium]